jgi:hypothetical protein
MNRLAPRLGSGFEPLEDRNLPTTFGIPWADPGHLTLSFAADGTPGPLGPSSLFKTMSAAGTTAAWEHEVLRAFQTWAVNANINVGLVADGGQPLGSVGAVQGDSRFGDVRVSAAPLSDTEVAAASPFSWTGTTFSGDVGFDSTRSFTIGNKSAAYDVFSVALHEAGHVFGLAHSTATDSVMQENYGYRTGLGASDIAAIRALYGARTPDAFDAAVGGGNDTLSRASAMPLSPSGNGQLLATGDISSTSDVDYYKFTTTPLLSALGVVVRLKASGISLLTPSVTVYDSLGRVVGSATSTDPLNNDLTVRFASLLGGTFYIKVAGATSDVFGVGGYKVAADFLSLGSVLAPLTNLLGLSPTSPGTDARFDATARGSITSATDTDTYRVHTNKYAAGTPVTLNVMVWALDTTPLNPRVHVYDAAGNPIAFQVLANDTGIFSLQVLNAVAGQDYSVQVAARNPGGANGTGSYFLGADFNQLTPTAFEGVTGGTVQSGSTVTDTLTVTDARLFEFALAPDAGTSGGVTMTVTDSAGRVVFTLTATAGQPAVTTTQYLSAGTYTVTYSRTGGGAGLVSYKLFLMELNDGVGPYGSGASTTTAGGSQSSDTTSPSDTSATYTTSNGTTRTTSYGYTY